MRVFRPCAADRQLFLSYGPYDNASLLLFYGFALRSNPADHVEVSLPVSRLAVPPRALNLRRACFGGIAERGASCGSAPRAYPQAPSDAHAAQRTSLLAAAGTSLEHKLAAPGRGAAGEGPAGPSGRLAPSLVAAARVLSATEEQLAGLRKLSTAQLKAKLAEPLSVVSEASARVAGSSGRDPTVSEGRTLDAAAVELLRAAVEAVRVPAAECLARLCRLSHEDGSLRAFAAVYAEGVVGICESALRSLAVLSKA